MTHWGLGGGGMAPRHVRFVHRRDRRGSHELVTGEWRVEWVSRTQNRYVSNDLLAGNDLGCWE